MGQRPCHRVRCFIVGRVNRSAIEVIFDRAIYLVRLRRHRQARRYTLRIAATTREVVLTIPPRGTLKEAREFAQKHGGWIAARLGRLPEAVRFADGIVIPLRGMPHRIAHRRNVRGTVWTESERRRRTRCCASPAKPRMSIGASAIFCAARPSATSRPQASVTPLSSASPSGGFRCAIRRAAGDPARPRACCPIPGGSSSRRAFVLNYLAAHEVAHLVEMNHSARFWRLVQRLCPDHERAKVWLDVHGSDLHRYGLPQNGAEV